ncbi:E3.2.1.4 [Mytilus edulis]|uniref:Endoglucanase n=1 Tax=Mytilus edulis TaxID=6550 RepID=A0A8S3RBQ9_MYTED|nr:E3.2.1.4 [Mytilus edulis]
MLIRWFGVLSVIIGVLDATPMVQVIDKGNGVFKGHFIFNLTEDLVGWKMQIDFSKAVTGLTSPVGLEFVKDSSNETVHYIVNKDHTGIQTTKHQFDIMVEGKTKDGSVPSAQAILQNMGHDTYNVPTPPNNDRTKYNYDEVLMKSIMFYRAQRSGKLPANNKIPWRGDSALNDRGQNGEDLTGGWYDAGDHVKFGFPQASAVTLLTWGLLQYKDAYEASGQLDDMYDCIRWPLEWLLKCHTGQNELYIQVGDGNLDHNFWGRPEDMTMARPSFKVTSDKPGSDVAGEYAAAMAVASMVFKDKDPAFSAKLLNHSKQIYTFWKDLSRNIQSKCKGSWSLLRITKKDVYKQDIETTFTNWLPGATGPNAVPYTPKGLAFRTKWGSLRHAANNAFMALLAAEAGIHPTKYRNWAKSQIGYILGDTGRSYVVGFGVNPPSHEHHRAASCPLIPASCSHDFYEMKYSNPHVLYGAIVGGPGPNDEYDDVRSDYVRNEVAVDYNAGFQGAVAGNL